MSLPALRQIRTAFPDAHIAVLIQEGLEPLLEGHPDLDQLIGWDPAQGQGWGEKFRWGKILRRERFDCAVILNPTKLFHAAAWAAGIPARVGYRRKWGFLLNRSIRDTKQSRSGHEADYNLELLPLLGIRPSKPLLKLPVRPEGNSEAVRLLESRGVKARPAAVHPWTSNTTKSWPMDSFRELVRLLDNQGIPVVIIGGEENLEAMRQWKAALPARAGDLVGQVPLKLLPALLKQCRVLVSNDSGPVHVAAAVGTPAMVVAPQSHAPVLKRWKPLGDPHQILIAPDASQVAEAVRSLGAP